MDEDDLEDLKRLRRGRVGFINLLSFFDMGKKIQASYVLHVLFVRL